MAQDLAENNAPRLTRSVAALFASVFCGSSASIAVVTVLGKQVYDLTHREIDLGLLGLVEFAPAALLVLLTGAVADRFPRHRVAAVALASEGLAIAMLGVYTARGNTSILPIFGLVFLFGIARAFTAPAQRSLPADLVPPDWVPWVIARNSAAWQAAVVIGPVTGGFLYVIDPALPYFVFAVVLLIAALLVLGVRPQRVSYTDQTSPLEAIAAHETQDLENARGGLSQALDGFRFVRRSPLLLGVISLDLFAVLFGGAIALLPAIAENLGVGAVGLGWLRAAAGIGAGVVTIVLAVRPIRRQVGRTLLLVVALFGVFTILLGLTSSFVVAFVAIAVLSGADAISVFIRATLVPLITPKEMRGRVLAIENVFIGASNELGAFESGVAGQLLGASGAVVLGGVGTLVVAATWALVFPALRLLDAFPSPDEQAKLQRSGGSTG